MYWLGASPEHKICFQAECPHVSLLPSESHLSPIGIPFAKVLPYNHVTIAEKSNEGKNELLLHIVSDLWRVPRCFPSKHGVDFWGFLPLLCVPLWLVIWLMLPLPNSLMNQNHWWLLCLSQLCLMSLLILLNSPSRSSLDRPMPVSQMPPASGCSPKHQAKMSLAILRKLSRGHLP